MSARSLIDSNEVFKSEKINARNECPDGKVSEPVCVEKLYGRWQPLHRFEKPPYRVVHQLNYSYRGLQCKCRWILSRR